MNDAGLFSRQGAIIPLQGVEIEGEVVGGHARLRVRQRYRNGEDHPLEAVYHFPLSSASILTGFWMTCQGRRLQGEVRPREAAFRAYDEAVRGGHGAALLDQERRNVFTAMVGNLLPGEETVIEIELLLPARVDEGALRLELPTVIAPRYIPGEPAGDRTADGWSPPTDRVPDADRITPPAGMPGYGVTLDLRFDLDRDVVIESPSHAIVTEREAGHRVRVRFARPEEPLDRDLLIDVRTAIDEPLSTVLTHRQGSGGGVFALTVVPDLLATLGKPPRQEVLFLIDVSGSMEGASLHEARTALHLCLRHLREGDRFNIIAFSDSYRLFRPGFVPFQQRTLEEADAWVEGLEAVGGTEMLAPLREAVQLTREGLIVLLTDGQVGNEDEILRNVLSVRKKARIYAFGIGSVVSDGLLLDLARQTGGAVERIYPGDRIDEKVVAQFARATAPRVDELELVFEGIEVHELAPSPAPALTDGDPWTVFGRFEGEGPGRAVIRGRLAGEPYALEVPFDASERTSRPVLPKLWAAERIRDLEGAVVLGRRTESNRGRIEALALDHGLATRYTSFVVVEERTGERKAEGVPETRTIPVHAPAGWALFEEPVASFKHMMMDVDDDQPLMVEYDLGELEEGPGVAGGTAYGAADGAWSGSGGGSRVQESFTAYGPEASYEEIDLFLPPPDVLLAPAPEPVVDPVVELLGRQLASGLWEAPGQAGEEASRQVRATTAALRELLAQGITSAHPLHGGQVRKAIDALVPRALALAGRDLELATVALEVAWRLASGRRTRGAVERAIQAEPALAACLTRWKAEPSISTVGRPPGL